mmetsp:Transcript_53867/g.65025  ORF Transcript_53867/g.65025 Transcript_53867/m.65025 type:complete len:150 (-) Transcript_53867:160-609(-)
MWQESGACDGVDSGAPDAMAASALNATSMSPNASMHDFLTCPVCGTGFISTSSHRHRIRFTCSNTVSNSMTCATSSCQFDVTVNDENAPKTCSDMRGVLARAYDEHSSVCCGLLCFRVAEEFDGRRNLVAGCGTCRANVVVLSGVSGNL